MGLGATPFGMLELALVDETEIDHIHRDFGVEDGLELIPDGLFKRTLDGSLGHGCGGFQTEGIGILLIDAGEASGGRHGVGATQRLGDHHLGAGGKLERIAARDLDRVGVALEDDFLVRVHCGRL